MIKGVLRKITDARAEHYRSPLAKPIENGKHPCTLSDLNCLTVGTAGTSQATAAAGDLRSANTIPLWHGSMNI